MDFSISHVLRQIDGYLSVVPPWLQVLISAYLAIVLATAAMGRVRERRGLLIAVVLFLVAVLLGLRAGSVLMALIS
jgi:hypothetical protein